MSVKRERRAGRKTGDDGAPTSGEQQKPMNPSRGAVRPATMVADDEASVSSSGGSSSTGNPPILPAAAVSSSGEQSSSTGRGSRGSKRSQRSVTILTSSDDERKHQLSSSSSSGEERRGGLRSSLRRGGAGSGVSLRSLSGDSSARGMSDRSFNDSARSFNSGESGSASGIGSLASGRGAGGGGTGRGLLSSDVSVRSLASVRSMLSGATTTTTHAAPARREGSSSPIRQGASGSGSDTSERTGALATAAPGAQPIFGGGRGWEGWDREEGQRAMGQSYQRHANVLRDTDACSDHGLDDFDDIDVDEFGVESSSRSGSGSGSSGRPRGNRRGRRGHGGFSSGSEGSSGESSSLPASKFIRPSTENMAAQDFMSKRRLSFPGPGRAEVDDPRAPSSSGAVLSTGPDRVGFSAVPPSSIGSSTALGTTGGRMGRLGSRSGRGPSGRPGLTERSVSMMGRKRFEEAMNEAESDLAGVKTAGFKRLTKREKACAVALVFVAIAATACAVVLVALPDSGPAKAAKSTAKGLHAIISGTEAATAKDGVGVPRENREMVPSAFSFFGGHQPQESSVPSKELQQDEIIRLAANDYEPNENNQPPPSLLAYYTSPQQTDGNGDIVIPSFVATNYANVWDPVTKLDVPMFWHIPKTGGTTVAEVFSQCLGLVLASEVGATEGHGQEDTLQVFITQGQFQSPYVNVDLSSFDGIDRAQRLNFAASGLADVVVTPLLHDASVLFDATHRSRTFTFLRHPVSRAVSMFYYLQKARWEPTYDSSLSAMSLEEYAQSGKIEDNWVVRSLTNESLGATITPQHVDVAKEILRRKILVGVVEWFDESLVRFEQYFGWWPTIANNPDKLMCQVDRLRNGSNRNDHPSILPGTTAFQLLAAKNWADVELYHYAKILFKEQASLV